jgi:hypothetical protein
VKDIDFGVDFVGGNSNKLQKNWVWKGKSVEPSMCSHCQINKFSFQKIVHIYIFNGNVFTLVPTMQATLAYIKYPKHLPPLYLLQELSVLAF